MTVRNYATLREENPNLEIRNKHKLPNSNDQNGNCPNRLEYEDEPWFLVWVIRILDFVLVSNFVLRISDFFAVAVAESRSVV